VKTNQLPPALILGGTTTALGFARSLSWKGIPVTVMAAFPEHPAMRSRTVRKVLSADPLDNPERCLEDILKWGRREGNKSVLIPTLEEFVKIVSDHREELAEYFYFRLPSRRLVDLMLDKGNQYRFMKECGLAGPVSVYFTGPDFVDLVTEEVGFPCVIKPCSSHVWRQVPGRFKALEIVSADELARAWKELHPLGQKFLAQEKIPGGDEYLYSYLGYLGKGSVPIADLTARKLRQQPAVYGSGSLIKSVEREDILELSRDALKKAGYLGHVDVEYKWDIRDESWRMIETNIRSTSFVQLAISSSIDLPWVGYLETLDQDQPLLPRQRNDVLFMHIGWDLQAALAEESSATLSFFAWLRMLAKVRSFAILNWRDPLPFLAEVCLYIRKLARMLQKRGMH